MSVDGRTGYGGIVHGCDKSDVLTEEERILRDFGFVDADVRADGFRKPYRHFIENAVIIRGTSGLMFELGIPPADVESD